MIRRSRLAALLVVSLLSLTGCGGASEHAPVLTIEAITGATASAQSARMTMDMTMDLGPATTAASFEGVSAWGEGGLRTVHGEMAGTMELPGIGEREGAMRMVDGRVFVTGVLAQSVGADIDGKGWHELTDEQTDAMMSMSGNAVSPADPAALLQALTVAANLEEVGVEDLDGTTTTHLRGVAGFSEFVRSMGSDVDEQLRAQEQFAGQSLPQEQRDRLAAAMEEISIELDVWVDGDSRVRRQRIRVDMSPMFEQLGQGAAPGDATMEMEVRLTDYGVPVEVEVPATD